MATKKMSNKAVSYPMSPEEHEAGYYQAQSELHREQIRKDEAAQDILDAKKRKAAASAKKTPDSKIPSEAMEVMRQKAKDAAYEEGEKERKKSMSTPFAKGGSVGAASRRADGCAAKGKTKGKMV